MCVCVCVCVCSEISQRGNIDDDGEMSSCSLQWSQNSSNTSEQLPWWGVQPDGGPCSWFYSQCTDSSTQEEQEDADKKQIHYTHMILK